MTAPTGDDLGFAPPRKQKALSRQRAAAIELIATISLTFSLVIAVAAVSLGNREFKHEAAGDRSAAQAPIGALLRQDNNWFRLLELQ
jgi:hypothetical protein